MRAGLDTLVAAGDPEWVLVHDAARCFVEPADAEAVLAAARDTRTGAAIPVIDVPDTVKEIEAGCVAGTLSRDRLALAQTPQAFRCGCAQRSASFSRPVSSARLRRFPRTTWDSPGRSGK